MTKVTASTRSISATEIARSWHLIDVKNKVLGREAPGIASLLQGKGKIAYAPYLDAGDFVVVVNAKNIKVTGKKMDQKEYQYYSGYPGGQRRVPYKRMLADKPEEIIKRAVSGMLPKNKLRDPRMSRLYIFADATHPYSDKFVK